MYILSPKLFCFNNYYNVCMHKICVHIVKRIFFYGCIFHFVQNQLFPFKTHMGIIYVLQHSEQQQKIILTSLFSAPKIYRTMISQVHLNTRSLKWLKNLFFQFQRKLIRELISLSYTVTEQLVIWRQGTAHMLLEIVQQH